MRKCFYIIILNFLFFNLHGQNLVPNFSFEEISECPEVGVNQLSIAFPWKDPSLGTDLYNSCISTYGANIPSAFSNDTAIGVGGELPNSGNGYVGLNLWGLNYANTREFISAPLLNPLERKTYQIEFFVSLLDSIRYGISNISAFFSEDSLPAFDNSSSSSLSFYYGINPQFTNSNIITRKNGWTKITGRFNADGGEKYITIGNFSSDNETNFALVDSCTWHFYNSMFQPLADNNFAYYILDDISVWKDTTTGFEESETFDFNLYPNPAKENISIQFTNGSKKLVATILSISGQQLLKQSISNKNSIDLSTIPNGVYYIEIANKRQKLFIYK